MSFILQEAGSALQDDYDVVMACVARSGTALSFASKRLQDNTSIVHAAVQQTPLSLTYASKRLRQDKTTILLAMTVLARP